ncbi:hypothetical protein TrVE_jg13078 [Triparma verrucosa]|uniref:Nucleoside phosphorylase domain-containing protein n=1 Tax=Triparma verrucosa TaxID=1606542 RepID=A0A9W7F4G3_9STRA|nr:hypothetical protein TrVE_jg13078 [Triparma verrucosa]
MSNFNNGSGTVGGGSGGGGADGNENNNNTVSGAGSGAPTPSDASLLTSLKRSRSPPPDRATRFMAAPLSAPTDPKRPRPRPSASRVLHLGLPPGALASRILTVGDPARAALLASHLTPRPQDKGRLFIHSSSRGFTTYTGLFLSTPISIISFGMGSQMIDFLVRESRDVAPPGPIIIISYGSAGGLKPTVPVGTCVIISQSVNVTRNSDHWTSGKGTPYNISLPVPANPRLTSHIYSQVKQSSPCVLGESATTCSFYSSQARTDGNFDDRNTTLISQIQKKANPTSMEMESFHLLDLARSTRGQNRIASGSAVVVVANRVTGEVVEGRKLAEVEGRVGVALLRAVCGVDLGEIWEGEDLNDGESDESA